MSPYCNNCGNHISSGYCRCAGGPYQYKWSDGVYRQLPQPLWGAGADPQQRAEHEMPMREIDIAGQQKAALQYRPVLQPVTPEAMQELEGRHAVGVLVATDQYAQVLNYSRQGFWWRDEWGAGGRVDRPTRGWFVELAKLKEVQQ